jgi:hypothetical protein
LGFAGASSAPAAPLGTGLTPEIGYGPRCGGEAYAHAHAPTLRRNATDSILDQIERFAPGFRDQILATEVRSATDIDIDTYNPNYVGGDTLTGRNDPLQVVMRPRISLDPYRTGIPGTYLCSAATPPGWFLPLVTFMLSPALVPILIHGCGHLYDNLRPTAPIENARERDCDRTV